MGTLFTKPPALVDGDTAFAADVNILADRTDSAFTQIEAITTGWEPVISAFTDKAEAWAENPEDSEVDPGKYSALHWAAKALAQANSAISSASTATTQAGIATGAASTATTQAGIATTKASEALASKNAADADVLLTHADVISAAASESNALSYRNTASSHASTATTQAGIATTSASTATTQAGIATSAAALLTATRVSAGSTASQINAKLASSLLVVLDPGTYIIDEQLVMQPTGTLLGSGHFNTVLSKTFNGDMFLKFPAGASICDLMCYGNGATYTGRLLPVTGTDGLQYMRNVRLVDADSYCLDFDTDAGSQSNFESCTIARYNGTAAGRYSIRIEDVEQLEAVPRKFTNIETDGTLCADLGGGGGAQFSGGFNGGFLFSSNTRGVHITDMRIGNIAEMVVDGHNNLIKGCGINPHITVAAGSDNNVITDNSYNNGITDNSGNGRNDIAYLSTPYTPVWTSSGTAPDLGNGAITGEHSRSGDKISVAIEFLIGSTTTFGTGVWRFSLPNSPTPYMDATQIFPVWLTDNGTTQIIGMAYLIDSTAYIQIAIPGSTGFVDATSPWTWAAGDMIRMSFTYLL